MSDELVFVIYTPNGYIDARDIVLNRAMAYVRLIIFPSGQPLSGKKVHILNQMEFYRALANIKKLHKLDIKKHQIIV